MKLDKKNVNSIWKTKKIYQIHPPMLPKGFLVGNVTADPSTGVSQNTQKNYSRFTVACDDRFVRANESAKSHFFNFVSWGRNATFIQEFVKKGDKVFVEFSISTSMYTNQEGKTIKNIDFFVDSIEKIGGSRTAAKKENNFEAPSTPEDTSSNPLEEETDEIGLDDIF